MNAPKLSLLAIAGLSLFAAGCGESGGPDPKEQKARVNSAAQMRTLFDKAGGDYAKLDAADKATFEKLAGSAAEAERTWGVMKAGPASGMVSRPPQGNP